MSGMGKRTGASEAASAQLDVTAGSVPPTLCKGVSMSKKTYQAVATAIYLASRPTCRQCGRGFVVLSGEAFGCPVHGIVEGVRPKPEDMLGEIIAGLGSTFKADNSRFDYRLFREACETGKCRGMRQKEWVLDAWRERAARQPGHGPTQRTDEKGVTHDTGVA